MTNKSRFKIGLFLLIVIIIITSIFLFNTKNDSFISKIAKYSENNYTELGLTTVNDSIIISSKELYNRNIITKDEYEDHKDVVFKIKLIDNNKVVINSYSEEYDYEKPIIVLKGPTTITLEYGTSYIEKGYTVEDNKDNDLSSKVEVTGKVNSNKVGLYKINYSVSDKSGNKATVSRTINVVDNEAPILKLSGSKTLNLYQGEKYSELGIASAIDNADGDVSESLIISGLVNTNKIGSYILEYKVVDKSANVSILKRIINIINIAPKTYTYPKILLNGASEINVYKDEVYQDLGVLTATDEIDGSIKDKVIITGLVNINNVGSYEMTYSVTNSKNLTTSVKRIVNVIKRSSIVTDFNVVGATTNMTIPGLYEDNITRVFSLENGLDQYGEAISLNNVTWEVNKLGVYITDGILSVSKNASIGDVDIKVTIGNVEKIVTVNLVKIPRLYTFDIVGQSTISVSGIINTESTYSVNNGKDQYGAEISIDSDSNEWSVINTPSNISIDTSGNLVLNANVSLGEVIIRIENDDVIQTKVITLNKIDIQSVTIKDGSTTINGTTVEMMVGETKSIACEITPTNATIQNGIWVSSNTNKVTISNDVISVIGGNTNDIIDISYTVDGILTTFQIKIIAPPVKYGVDSVEMEYGDQEIITATPRSGTVVYSSSNNNIATVDSSTGKITITGVGDAVITASVTDLGTDTLNVKANKAVVDVILFAGQSNMMGAATSASNQIPDEGTAWEYRNSTNSLKYLTSQVGEAYSTYASASYASSLLTSFAKEYVSSVGRKVVAIHSPRDGSNISAWQPTQGVLVTAETRYNNALTYLQNNANFTVGRKLFVWLQGESNMVSAGTKSGYKTSFINMKNDINTNTGINQFLIIRVGNQPGRALDYVKEILHAQNELAYENNDIVMATKSAYNISKDATLMNADMLHFNNLGLDALGAEAASNYATYLNTGNEPFMYDFLTPQKIANRWNYASNIQDSVGGITSSVVSGIVNNNDGKVALNGNSYTSLNTSVSLLTTKMWAINFKGKLSTDSSNGMLFTHIDNSDAYLWLDGSSNQIKLRSNASTEVVFPVSAGDLTTTNEWRLEYLPIVKEITLFKNGEYVTRVSYTAAVNFVFNGMYGGYKTSDYQYGFNGEIDDISIYNDEVLPIYVSSISTNLSTANLYVGETKQITAVVLPVTANNKNLTYESSDENIAIVNSSGLITGVGGGTATITIRSVDGNTQSQGTVIVSGDSIPVTGISINKASTTIRKDSTETLTATVVPYYAGNKVVTWTTSDANVATVSSSGIVTGINNGVATITATSAEGGYTSTCTVTINSFPGLWQGTRIRNGITATISGNHITLNGTKNVTDISSGSGYFNDNHMVLYDPITVWYTFPAGTQVSIIVSNSTGTSNANVVNSSFGLRRSDLGILTGTTWGTRTGTFNYTFSSITSVYGFVFYLGVGEVVTNYQFDVEFWVNGVRWF